MTTYKSTIVEAVKFPNASETYKQKRLELIKILLPVVTGGNTDLTFVQNVLKLGPATYDPIKHWPKYVAVRVVQMADAILKENEAR